MNHLAYLNNNPVELRGCVVCSTQTRSLVVLLILPLCKQFYGMRQGFLATVFLKNVWPYLRIEDLNAFGPQFAPLLQVPLQGINRNGRMN
jgi:hypothetical protein